MEQHQFINILKNVFNIRAERPWSFSSDPSISYNKYNIFSKYFVVNLSSKTRDIPVFCNNSIISCLRNLSVNDEKTIALHLLEQTTVLRRSYDTAIRDFFGLVVRTTGLIKLVTPKGEIYYGGPGIIMDKDFNILMLLCYDLDSTDTFMVSGVSIKISPRVYHNPTGLLEKAIINKVIPIYATSSFTISSSLFTSLNIQVHPKIIIDNLDNYIRGIEGPSNIETLDEDINQFLARNSNDIIQYIESRH